MKTKTKQTYIIMYGTEKNKKAEMVLASNLEDIWRMICGLSVRNAMEPKYIVLPDARRIELNYGLFHHCYDNGYITEAELMKLCVPEMLHELKTKVCSTFNKFLI